MLKVRRVGASDTVGIDLQGCPHDLRRKVWNRLAGDLKVSGLESLCQEFGPGEISETIEHMLQGRLRGRNPGECVLHAGVTSGECFINDGRYG